MKIETERLLIRSPQEGDFESSKEIWTDPKVRQFSGGPATNEDFEKGFFTDLKKTQTDFGFRTVLEKKSGDHAGDCGLIQKEIEAKSEVEIMYFFNVSYWGKGFATEAANAMVEFGFNKLGLKRVVALIHPENEASKKVAEKLRLGFEKDVLTESGNKRFLYSKVKSL